MFDKSISGKDLLKFRDIFSDEPTAYEAGVVPFVVINLYRR
jgi:hypothetical protein